MQHIYKHKLQKAKRQKTEQLINTGAAVLPRPTIPRTAPVRGPDHELITRDDNIGSRFDHRLFVIKQSIKVNR